MRLPVDFGTMVAALASVVVMVVACWIGAYVAWALYEFN